MDSKVLLLNDLYTNNGGHLLAKGVIDFACEEEEGWVIVDFKTDSLQKYFIL